MARNLTYDAIGSGLNGFADNFLRMMEFKDRRDERAERLQLAEQENAARRTAFEEKRVAEQAKLDEEVQKRQFELDQKQAARDVYTVGAILKLEPGQNVTPDWLPVLNRSYPQYPDFESVQRTEDGVMINAKSNFELPGGQKTRRLAIGEEQLHQMFNAQLSSLDTVGLEMYGKLASAFGVDAISPTQRASALSNLIDIKRRNKTEAENDGDFPRAKSLQSEINGLATQYEELLGIKTPKQENPQQKQAFEKYQQEYERFSAGGGWGKFVKGAGGTNDRGIDAKEQTRLDELWALTGRPRSESPHRGGEVSSSVASTTEADAAPAAPAGKVMIETPDGRRGLIPEENLKQALAAGARVVQ